MSTLRHTARRSKAWIAGGVLAGVAGLAALVFGGCQMPGPKATPEQIGALPRAMLDERVGVPRVSYLHAAPKGVDATTADELPRVIYIHGTPGDATGWADFLVEPIAGLHADSVDRAGFGRSLPSREETSFQMQAAAIAPLLVERGGQWPIVVGHSLGGPIAARLAADSPGKVRALVIVAGSLDPAMETGSFWQSVGTSGVVRAIMPRALDHSMGELDAAKRETTLLRPLLANITCPIIVIHGTADKLVPYANVDYIALECVNAQRVEVVTLKDQNHFIPWERPDVIRATVEKLRDE